MDPNAALAEAVSLARTILTSILSCLQALTVNVPLLPGIAGYPAYANPTVTIDPVRVFDSVAFKVVGDLGTGVIARHGGPLGFLSRMLGGKASIEVSRDALTGDSADVFGVAVGMTGYQGMLRKRAFALLHEVGHDAWYQAFLLNPLVGFLGNAAHETRSAKQKLASDCFK
jgi:hypothetical protein